MGSPQFAVPPLEQLAASGYRPVAVYTLHTMDGDGGNLCAI